MRRAFKAAWTPPYGPTYASWHTDFIDENIRTEIISHEKIDPRMRIRPNPKEVERAAKLLVEAKSPLMIVGDELYNAKAVDKAVKLAELIGMPVTQVRQVFAISQRVTISGWVPLLGEESSRSLFRRT